MRPPAEKSIPLLGDIPPLSFLSSINSVEVKAKVVLLLPQHRLHPQLVEGVVVTRTPTEQMDLESPTVLIPTEIMDRKVPKALKALKTQMAQATMTTTPIVVSILPRLLAPNPTSGLEFRSKTLSSCKLPSLA